jgi:hypothetical protein
LVKMPLLLMHLNLLSDSRHTDFLWKLLTLA